MAITLSDDEGSNQDSDSDQEGMFMAFTTTIVIDEAIVVKSKSPTDEELSKNANLQEVYNKLCNTVAKDAMIVDLSLKKIDSPELEKKNILIKLFDTNELLNAIKIENMSLVEKIKKLETDLSVTREQLDRSSCTKLDEMLGAQKSPSDKTSLGYVENGSTSKKSST